MTISVVIPAYNAQAHIARAIDSVLAQTLPPDEIIIVDDGSTDNTANIVKSYGDKVTYIHQPNSGSGATRNAGINAATSEWIAFLDSDDQWLPEKLQLQTEYLQNHPNLNWAHSNFYTFSQSRNTNQISRDAQKAAELLKEKTYFENYFHSFAAGFPAWTSTIIAKRDIILQTGPFDPSLPLAQDIDLWFKIAYTHPAVGYIPQPLAIYNTETPNSNVKKFTDISYICNLLDIHIKLSKKHNRHDDFAICVHPIVHDWVLKLTNQQRHADTRHLLKRYRQYLPPSYYLRKNFRALFPAPVACYNTIASKMKK